MTYPALTREHVISCNEFHSSVRKGSDGLCQRWRRNGATKTWKRDVTRFYVGVKHGLYDYDYISENSPLTEIHCACQCADDAS